MKIKNRLIINNWISLIITFFIVIILSWSFWNIYRADRNEKLVDEMKKTAFERIVLRDDYLLNREERAGIQWHLKSEALRKLLETAAENFSSAEDKLLLQEARKSFDATFTIFSGIMERNRPETRRANSKTISDEAGTRQIGQVFLKAYALMDIINRLHESTMREKTKAQNNGLLLIIILFAGGGLAIIANSTSINRTVAKRLTALNQGVEIIGNGNLNYKIALAGNDELADLAKAVNETVAKLNQSYTSVENLQREISERKKMEEDIKKLSLHQQTLLDAIPDIIMEVDTNKVYTWANGPGIEFFGKDVVGKEAALYFVREQITYNTVQPIFKGSEDVIYVESWQKRKDGQERLLAWWCHVLKDAQGNVTGALSSARDITDRKRAEEELRRNEKVLRESQRIAHIGSWHLDVATNNVVWTEELYNMYGVDPSLPPPPYTEHMKLFTPESWERLSTALARTRDTGIPYTLELETVRKDGSNGWMWVQGQADVDSSGKTIGLWGAAQDITDRKRTEAEIRKLNEDLEQRVAERTAELSAKTDELERINKVFIGRELKMAELKERIAELEKQKT